MRMVCSLNPIVLSNALCQIKSAISEAFGGYCFIEIAIDCDKITGFDISFLFTFFKHIMVYVYMYSLPLNVYNQSGSKAQLVGAPV